MNTRTGDDYLRELRLFRSSEVRGGPGQIAGPLSVLLDELLRSLSKEEKVRMISEALDCVRWLTDERAEEEAIMLVRALIRLFGEDEVLLRAHLWVVYGGLRSQTESVHLGSPPSCKLPIAILKEIIQGWGPSGGWNPSGEDGLACFQRVCQAYEMGMFSPFARGGLTQNLKNGIRDLFRERLKKDDWKAEELDQYILATETPDDIAELLSHVQIRIGGSSFVRERLHRLD